MRSYSRRLLAGALVLWVSTVCVAQEGLRVCIGPDRVVREALVGGCGSNEKSYRLAEEKAETEAPEDPDEPQDLQRELTKLAQRVATLESARKPDATSTTSAQRVTAPFEVVDRDGNLILRVQDRDPSARRGLHIFGNNGSLAAQVAVAGEGDGGGRLFAYAPNAPRGTTRVGFAALSYDNDGPILSLTDANSRPELSYSKKSLSMWEGDARRFAADDKGVIARGSLSVVDNRGTQIVAISEGTGNSVRGLAVSNERNQLAVKLGAYAAGGRVTAVGQNPAQYVSMAWEESGPYLRMTSKGGNRLASLAREGLQLFGDEDRAYASLSEASEIGGGALVLSRADGTKHASLDAKGATIYNDKEKGLARLGGVTGEGGNLLLGSGEGDPTVELFHNETPALNLKKSDGSKVASLGAHGFHLYNRAGAAIAGIAAGPGDSGIFQLYSAAGSTSVEAGTLADGTGTVRAGPLYRCAAAPAMPTLSAAGLPDCIKGRLK